MLKTQLKDILEKEAPSKQEILKRVQAKKKQAVQTPKSNTGSLVAGAAVVGALAGVLSTLFLVPKAKALASKITQKITGETITPMAADSTELLEFDDIAADDFGFSADLNNEAIEDFSLHAETEVTETEEATEEVEKPE